MKLKRMVSVMAALAVSATTFAGMVVTANAEEVKYSDNFETGQASYTWFGNADQRIIADNATKNNKNGFAYSIRGASNGRTRPAWTVVSEEGLIGKIHVNFNFRMDTTYNNTSPQATIKLLGAIPSDANNDIAAGSSILEFQQESSNNGYDAVYRLNGETITGISNYGSDYSSSRNSSGWLNMDVVIDTTDKVFNISICEIENTTDGFAVNEIPIFYKDDVAFYSNTVENLKSLYVFSSRYPTYDGGIVWLDDINISTLQAPKFTMSTDNVVIEEEEASTVSLTDVFAKTITASSNDTDIAVAEYDKESNVITITGVSKGETKVLVSAENDGLVQQEYIQVTVNEKQIVSTIPSAVSATHVLDYTDESAEDAATGASLWEALIEGTGTAYNAFDIAGTIMNAEGVVKTSNQQYDMGTTISTGDVYIYIAVNQAKAKLADGQTMELTVTPVSK